MDYIYIFVYIYMGYIKIIIFIYIYDIGLRHMATGTSAGCLNSGSGTSEIRAPWLLGVRCMIYYHILHIYIYTYITIYPYIIHIYIYMSYIYIDMYSIYICIIYIYTKKRKVEFALGTVVD